MTNETIKYYDENAQQYYESTAGVDFTDAYERFLRYVPEGGRIIDVGCGSGRDAAAFARMGYDAVGLDASEELAKLARRENGIEVIVADMADWTANEPYDGIWCCASLLHLDDAGVGAFFKNLKTNLRSGGAIYLSVKSGIETETDDRGRFMRNFTEEEIRSWMDPAGIRVMETWTTGDRLARGGFCWLNVIGCRQ